MDKDKSVLVLAGAVMCAIAAAAVFGIWWLLGEFTIGGGWLLLLLPFVVIAGIAVLFNKNDRSPH